MQELTLFPVPLISISLLSANESFCCANPIQSSSSSVLLHGKTFAPKRDKKSCSNPASVASLCNLSTSTILCERSMSSINTSSSDNLNNGKQILSLPSFPTAAQQLIATIIPATPLNIYVYRLNHNSRTKGKLQ